MVRLSIVIPAVVVDQLLEDTLVSVLTHRPKQSEVLVAFSGAYEDPYGIGDEVRLLEMPSETSLLGLLNAAVEASRGEIVVVLAPGHEVSDGWSHVPVQRLLRDLSLGSISPVVLRADGSDQIAVAGIIAGSRGKRVTAAAGASLATADLDQLEIDGPPLAAGFYRRRALYHVGGFDPTVGAAWADLDLALAMRRAQYRSACEPACCLRIADVSRGWFEGFHEGRQAERIYWRYKTQGAQPPSIAIHSADEPAEESSLARSSAAVAPTGALAWLGRWCGWVDMLRGRHVRECRLATHRATEPTLAKTGGKWWRVDGAHKPDEHKRSGEASMPSELAIPPARRAAGR